MSKSPLMAIKFIKNVQKLHDYECTVCLQIYPYVYRCSGPCKSPLCLRCATNIALTQYKPKCPKRCSQKLKLEPIPNLQFEYTCSYGGEKCKERIVGIISFNRHSCQYATKEIMLKKKRDLDYLCPKGHQLIYIDLRIRVHLFSQVSMECVNRPCFHCGQQRLCESYCIQCSSQSKIATYCHNCCSLPCTKKLCPNAHPLKVISSKHMICGMCSFDSSLYTDVFYMDFRCDFGFCQNCYEMMPEKHPLVPLKRTADYKKKHAKQISQMKTYVSHPYYELSSDQENENEPMDYGEINYQTYLKFEQLYGNEQQ